MKCKSFSIDTRLIRKYTLLLEIEGYSIQLEMLEPICIEKWEEPNHCEHYDLVGCEFPGIDIIGHVYTAQLTPDNLEQWVGTQILEYVTDIVIRESERNTETFIKVANLAVEVTVQRLEGV